MSNGNRSVSTTLLKRLGRVLGSAIGTKHSNDARAEGGSEAEAAQTASIRDAKVTLYTNAEALADYIGDQHTLLTGSCPRLGMMDLAEQLLGFAQLCKQTVDVNWGRLRGIPKRPLPLNDGPPWLRIYNCAILIIESVRRWHECLSLFDLIRLEDNRSWEELATVLWEAVDEGRSDAEKSPERVVPDHGTPPTKRQHRAEARSDCKTKRITRIKAETKEPLIVEHLSRRPHDTAKQVAEAVGCSTGLVGQSAAWRTNQDRLRVARKEGVDPIAVKLDATAINAAGGSPRRQLHAHKAEIEDRDEMLDKADAELLRRIGEVQKRNPRATPQEIAAELGCTAGEVERRQAMLDKLTAEQAENAKEDDGLAKGDPEESRHRNWVEKRP